MKIVKFCDIVGQQLSICSDRIPLEQECIDFFVKQNNEDKEMILFLMTLCVEYFYTDRMKKEND